MIKFQAGNPCCYPYKLKPDHTGCPKRESQQSDQQNSVERPEPKQLKERATVWRGHGCGVCTKKKNTDGGASRAAPVSLPLEVTRIQQSTANTLMTSRFILEI